MVCWPRLQHGHAPLRYEPSTPLWAWLLYIPRFFVMAAVKRCGLLIVFDLFELFFNAHSYYQVLLLLLLLYDCVVKHLVPLAVLYVEAKWCH